MENKCWKQTDTHEARNGTHVSLLAEPMGKIVNEVNCMPYW